MKTLKLIKLTRIHWSLLCLALLGAALSLTSQSARRWLLHHAAAMSAAVLRKPLTATGQTWTTVVLSQPFTVRGYGGKCLEFGPPPPAPRQAIVGNPLFISDCNGTVAQQVRVEELPGPGHLVILRMGNGVIGKSGIPVVILQTGFTAQAGADSAEQASSAALGSTNTADQIPLEVQSYTGSDGQKFVLDGDSIILATDRNLVVEVQNHRGANGTPLVLGHRDLDDSEFWTFTATDGSGRKPTSGFVRISQIDNSADGELRARADFLNAVYGAKSGTVIELDPNVSLNLADTPPPLLIPASVTIRGDRRGTNSGPELYVQEGYHTAMIQIDGKDVRITGLRLRGPSDSADEDTPGATGIYVDDGEHPGSIIDHNEMLKWPGEAVSVNRENNVEPECGDHRDPRSLPEKIRIARNFIHQNERQDAGYGVGVNRGGHALIEGNTFVSNRHAIAAGAGDTIYRARHNLVLSYAPYQYFGGAPRGHTQDFDMHGTGTAPISGSGYGGSGGQYVEIARNTFLATNRENFELRGEPCFLAEFHHNVSLRHLTPVMIANTLDILYPAVVCSSSNCGGKLKVYDNQFGASNPTGRLGVGDFDGDGKDDLFLATGAAWYYAPAGIAEWRFFNAQTDGIGSLLFGDFDGDGRTDVFTQHGSNWDVSWGGASQWEKINGSGPLLGNAAIGDFDGDHRADVFYADGQHWYVSYGGVGMFQLINDSGYRVPYLRFGDFDGDGKTDVFTVGRNWQVSYGGTTVWQPLPHKLTGSVAGLIVADFNGDGRADVATAGINFQSGLVWKISYGGVENWAQNLLPRNSIAAIGRFNGNAGADLLLWNDNFLEIDPGGSGASHSHSRQDMR